MPRIARKAPGGVVYHVLNRANGRLKLFKKEEDFLAFEQVLLLAHRRMPIRIMGWCVMSNHWHLVLWPRRDGELTAFMRWLTLTHAQRWKHAHAAVGHGHLYQGRFKSFPIQQDEHLLAVLRYVERNPVRAGLVKRSIDWRWSSATVRRSGPADMMALLSPWSVDRPDDWDKRVDAAQPEEEEAAIQTSIRRGSPFGGATWIKRTAVALDLSQTLRPRGRPIGVAKAEEMTGNGRTPQDGSRPL